MIVRIDLPSESDSNALAVEHHGPPDHRTMLHVYDRDAPGPVMIVAMLSPTARRRLLAALLLCEDAIRNIGGPVTLPEGPVSDAARTMRAKVLAGLDP